MNVKFSLNDNSSIHKRDVYIVFVDDNFHFDDEERYIQGEYESLEDAISVCQKIVEDFLTTSYKPGMKSDDLLKLYKTFGEDPYIQGYSFSAWSYAETICTKICKWSI
ncbi:MAG: hypothetical protein L6Q54_00165 [Leptospiraceae bacterium]|nr:hypothetical protein [Leptospiraceae bacterium]MCK6379650.1 hypothetical protein [Leptospiraceae bacterium]NUM40104.1 hypothetical protein [Leptospiraceae bacterium]